MEREGRKCRPSADLQADLNSILDNSTVAKLVSDDQLLRFTGLLRKTAVTLLQSEYERPPDLRASLSLIGRVASMKAFRTLSIENRAGTGRWEWPSKDLLEKARLQEEVLHIFKQRMRRGEDEAPQDDDPT